MPKPGDIKVVDEIFFIFVPEFPPSRLREHWATLNGNRIHVYEPYQVDFWTVVSYRNDTTEQSSSTEDDHSRYPNQEAAFKQASIWAKDAFLHVHLFG